MTPRPHTPHTPPKRRLTAAVLGMATAITLTACSADSDADGANGDHSSNASSAAQGVVTAKAAAAVVDNYEKVNNEANKTQNEKLLATVETGQVHEESRADYKQWSTWSKKDQQEYGSNFFYRTRKYYIPAAGTADWFAVKATSSGSSKDALLVFEKADRTYKLTAAVYADDGLAMPEIAIDSHGLAKVANPSDNVGTLAPSRVGKAFEDLYATGGKKEGKQLASSPATKAAVKEYTERNTGKDASWLMTNYFAAKPTHPKVYALSLADGGVLTVFPSAHTIEYMNKQYMHGYVVIPGKTEALYDPKKRPVITDEFQGQAMATLSPKGKPRVVAYEYRMVDSR